MFGYSTLVESSLNFYWGDLTVILNSIVSRHGVDCYVQVFYSLMLNLFSGTLQLPDNLGLIESYGYGNNGNKDIN